MAGYAGNYDAAVQALGLTSAARSAVLPVSARRARHRPIREPRPWRGKEKSTMGYENLTPALERIKMVSGYIASHGKDIKTVFALEDHYRDTPQMAEAVLRMKADPRVGRLISEGYTTPD